LQREGVIISLSYGVSKLKAEINNKNADRNYQDAKKNRRGCCTDGCWGRYSGKKSMKSIVKVSITFY
jgi:hypothetical protein